LNDWESGQIYPGKGTNSSRQSVSGWYLWGDELGKVDFGQKPEGIKSLQIRNDRVVTELNRHYDQRGMTDAVYAAVTAVIILMMLKRGAGGIIVGGVLFQHGTARIYLTLHGMRAFMHAMDRNDQYGEQQK